MAQKKQLSLTFSRTAGPSSTIRGPGGLPFNPAAGAIKARENQGVWNEAGVLHQAKMDSVYKKKSLDQQVMKLAQQITEALKTKGVVVQSTQVKVLLMDAVRRSSDSALAKSWPAAVSLRGFEKNMPVRSRASASGEFELGIVTRVKANGNYGDPQTCVLKIRLGRVAKTNRFDTPRLSLFCPASPHRPTGALSRTEPLRICAHPDIEKRVDDLCSERLAEVRRQVERTGIRISLVNDGNVPPHDIIELEGARFKAFGITEEPATELAILSACRQFDLGAVAKLLGTEIPKPKTYGLNRTGLY